jgi:hypothetical protein
MRKNCVGAQAIQIQNRTRAAKLTAMNEYRQARRREKHGFRKKKGQLDDQTLFEIERHHIVQDFRKFYKCLNDAMCKATNGQLLTNKDQVLSIVPKRSHMRTKPPRENVVVIDLPSRDEFVEAIKYLKDNKTVGSTSIAAELLISDSPSPDLKAGSRGTVSSVQKER